MVVIIGTIVQILSLMDVNVTALIAGISIGGLALALAAKDTVSNLIGSIMVFMDKPFQIGDYIEIGSMGGTVKEVGFRSTRIQTKDTSIISIPNGNIANTALTNKGVRVFRLFETMLGVTYDTNPDLIETFIEKLKKMIIDDPRVTNDDFYIALNGLGPSSLDILFRVYLNTSDYAGEIKIKEDLILNILRMAEELGVSFAFPSTSVYIEKGS
jgi:MscS family membrane protein